MRDGEGRARPRPDPGAGIDRVRHERVDACRPHLLQRHLEGDRPAPPRVEGVNQQPRGNQYFLFTPAWGSSTPNLSNAAYIVLEPFPAAAIGTDLNATVSAVGTGQVAIPSDGAVIVATGADAAKLQAEAPLDSQVAVRLILPDARGAPVVSAVGGGPQLVKGGKPLFTTSKPPGNSHPAATRGRSGSSR